MKYKVLIIFIAALFFILPMNVFAGSISATNAEPGGTISVTVYFGTTHSVDIDLDYSGPVSPISSTTYSYYDPTGGDSPISSKTFTFSADSEGTAYFSASISGKSDEDGNALADEGTNTATSYISSPDPEPEQSNEEYDGNDYGGEEESTVISNPVDNNDNKKDKDKEKETNNQEEQEENNEPEVTETPKITALALQSLTVKGYTLSPVFSANVKEYSLDIKDLDVFNLEVEAKANKEDCSIVISGNQNIKVGENIITISVRTNDDKEKVEYKIKVNKKVETYKDELDEANKQIDNLNKQIEQKNGTISMLTIGLIVTIVIAATIIVGIVIKNKKK